MKILIIGGVAAGTKTAAKLKREDRNIDVTVITKDKDISYAGCGLPYYVGGLIEGRDELIVQDIPLILRPYMAALQLFRQLLVYIL